MVRLSERRPKNKQTKTLANCERVNRRLSVSASDQGEDCASANNRTEGEHLVGFSLDWLHLRTPFGSFFCFCFFCLFFFLFFFSPSVAKPAGRPAGRQARSTCLHSNCSRQCVKTSVAFHSSDFRHPQNSCKKRPKNTFINYNNTRGFRFGSIQCRLVLMLLVPLLLPMLMLLLALLVLLFRCWLLWACWQIIIKNEQTTRRLFMLEQANLAKVVDCKTATLAEEFSAAR